MKARGPRLDIPDHRASAGVGLSAFIPSLGKPVGIANPGAQGLAPGSP